MSRFRPNAIASLVSDHPKHALGESYGRSLRLEELLVSNGDSSLDKAELDYGSIDGSLALRAAIARDWSVDPGDVVVTVGSAHALFISSFVLLDRGDEVVTTAPIFPPTRAVFDALGARVTALRSSFDRGYRLDLDEFCAALSPRTRLVSVASPQNPSGVAIPLETLHRMLEAMDNVCPQAYLLVDEVYRYASYGDDPVAETACALGPKIISTASLSKCHGAPGLRIGWLIARDGALRDQLVLAKFNSVIACSPLDERLAVRVFERTAPIMRERRAHLQAALQRTADWIAQNGRYVEWVRPSAGSICCVRLKATAFDRAAVERFYKELKTNDASVALGAWFGDEERVFRLGFGLPTLAQLDDGLAVLAAALAACAA